MKRSTSIISLIFVCTLMIFSAHRSDAQSWISPIVTQFQHDGLLDALQPFDGAANATRAEFVWLIVQIQGGFGEPMVTQATFDDVPAANAYFGAFEAAAAEEWMTGARGCAGTHPCFAKPWDTINRAEAAAIISRAFGLAPLSSPAPMPDVPSSAWYYRSMQTAAANCILRGDGDTGMFRPAGILNRAEMITMLDRARKPAEYWLCHESTSSASSESSASSTSSFDSAQDDKPIADLTLEMIATQTIAESIPRGTQALPVLRIKAAASCEKDISIDAITIAHAGQGYISDVEGVWLRGDGRRLSRVQTLSNDDSTATVYLYAPFIIRACDDRLLEVMADFRRDAAPSTRHRFSLDWETDIQTNAATIAADLPFESGNFTLSTKQTGIVNIRYLPVEEVIEEELMHAVIGRFALSIDTTEDQVIHRLQLENTGTARDGDFANLWIRGFGTRLSNFERQTTDDAITFTFDPPEPIELEQAGEEFIYEVVADIVSGKGKDIRMQLREESDIFAVGSKYGHGTNAQMYGSAATMEGRASRVRIYGSSVPQDTLELR